WRVRRTQVVNRIDDSAAHQVCPHAIRNHLPEVRVFRRGYPVCQYLTRVFFRSEVERFAEERRRRHFFAAYGMLHHAAAATPGAVPEMNRFLAAADRCRNADALSPDAAEERREAVEVVLAPYFKRVMVALRTIEPHAKE